MQLIKISASQPVKFETSGRFIADDGWVHKKRVIKSFEIITVVEGTLNLEYNNQHYVLARGDTLLILPGIEHAGFGKAAEGMSFYWAHFNPRDGHDRILVPDENDQTEDHIILPEYFPKTNLERIIILFSQMCHINESGYTSKWAMDYAMTSILLEISDQYLRTAKPSGRQSKMERILEWIRVNVNKNISLSDVAHEFNYSKEYLSRKFHDDNGITMQRYINRLRITKAKELLTMGDYQIKEIADIVGIADEKYFLRLFKEYEHLSPGQYRNAFGKIHINKK